MMKYAFKFCIGFILTAGVVFCAVSSQAQSKTPGVKYNVLFIAVDDLRPELGAYGQSHIKSPNIDKIANNGVTFDRAYCAMAFCNPSRASLLTGLRPDSIEVYDLFTHFRKKMPHAVSLPEYFKNNGYYTASFSKIFHLADEQSWSQPAWHTSAGYVLKESLDLMKQSPKKRGPLAENADVPDSAYVDGKTVNAAINTLRKIKDKSFFLAVGFAKPHIPFTAPKKYWDMYDPSEIKVPDTILPANIPDVAYIGLGTGELNPYADGHPETRRYVGNQAIELMRGYYACVSYVDAQVGKIMDELKALGLEKNTIVILWGDHGWKLGEYGEWGKRSNMELDLRSPLIVSTPEMREKGKHAAGLVEFIDIYPTLCQEAGLPVPAGLQGKSFSKLLDNPDADFKKAAFSQVGRPATKSMGYSMRTDRYRYTRWVDEFNNKHILGEELYDHKTDPKEMRNVANDPAYASILAKLSNQYNMSEK